MSDATALVVPDDLTERDQWVLWRYGQRAGKETKLPYQANGKLASSTDPSTWASHMAVTATYRERPKHWSGIGFVFSREDPYCGVDLDDCLAAGKLKEWAQPIIGTFADTYSEISPSGDGIKIWCKAKLPGAGLSKKHADGGIEFYDRGRFFTVTGNAFNGAPAQLEEHQRDVERLYAQVAGNSNGNRSTGKRAGPQADLNDSQPVPEGGRYKYLQSVAAQYRGRGMDRDEIYAAIAAINAQRCTPPKADSVLQELADWAGSLEPGGGLKKKGAAEIRVNGRELRDLSKEVLEALKVANAPEPKLFSRSGSIVRVDFTETGLPEVITVTDVHLRGEMTLAADFYKVLKTEDGFVKTTVLPPIDVAKNLLSRPPQELNLPGLVSIAEAPFLGPDGTVVSKPGYDPVTRTFYAPSGTVAGFDVPDLPTVDDVDGARALIEEVFENFPFIDAASRANALGLFITSELRPAIRGNVPAALIDAPQLGTGKSLIADVVALKSTGRSALMKSAPKSDSEEWRKMLTATLQAGHGLTVFDNVESVLSSPDLARVLTAGMVTDRVLGRTEMITLPVRTVFVVTGNNLVLGGDMPRRCYWIRVDAESSEPWMNRTFRHPDLTGWVLSNRGRLLSAVLTLARAWYVAGCPAAPTPVLGSFEEWCRTVGGILHFAGIEGFLGNLEELYRNADPSQAAWEAFLSELLERMPRDFKVSEVVVELQKGQSLRESLPEDLGDMEPISGFQRRLGRAFVKRTNRRFGARALRLVRNVDTYRRAVVWGVRQGRV